MNIKIFLKNHNSFIVIILGAVALFFSNILLKKVFSPTDYGEYSLFITFLQLMGSFGLLGFDQVFLRFSEVDKKNTIKTNKTLLLILIFVWFFIGLVSAFIFKNYFSDIDIALVFLIITTLIITFSKFIYNVFRLNADFITSQLILNFWRYFVGIVTFSFLILNWTSISKFVKFLSVLLLLFLIVQLVYLLKKISFSFIISKSFKEISYYAFHFLIALLTISFIAYSDRFFIKIQFGGEVLGDYFYLATIFLLPYSILQGYVGFKELVAFKKEASIQLLYKKLLILNLLGITMAVMIVLASMFINQFDMIATIDLIGNKTLVFVFLITGIIKLNYGLFSALLGAQTEMKTIKKANIQSLLLICCLIVLFYSYITKIEYVALLILFFWLTRTLIYNFNLKKQFSKQND